jgi:hypothetical protein
MPLSAQAKRNEHSYIYQSNNINHMEIKQFMNYQSREEYISGEGKIIE